MQGKLLTVEASRESVKDVIEVSEVLKAFRLFIKVTKTLTHFRKSF
jgi:hypothetical protein